MHYTIPSDNRELQLLEGCDYNECYYTIPSDNRELQQHESIQKQNLIIPYQVITGNYNDMRAELITRIIIPYQVITGNYNCLKVPSP